MLALAGCNSTSSVDALNIPRPSMETTNSIPKLSKPVPLVETAPMQTALGNILRKLIVQRAAVLSVPELEAVSRRFHCGT